MSSGNWVIYLSLFFVFVGKLLEYTSTYHERLVSNLAFPNVREAGEKYGQKLSAYQELQAANRLVSAQDDYARWTKNNRRLTQLEKELNSLKQQFNDASGKNKHILGRLRLLTLTVPFLALKMWKGKHIVYNLPRPDIFPKFLSGLWSQGWLYLGLAPLRMLTSRSVSTSTLTEAGVSLGIWIWALQRVIETIEFLVKQILLNPVVVQPPMTATKQDKIHEITDDDVELD